MFRLLRKPTAYTVSGVLLIVPAANAEADWFEKAAKSMIDTSHAAAPDSPQSRAGTAVYRDHLLPAEKAARTAELAAGELQQLSLGGERFHIFVRLDRR